MPLDMSDSAFTTTTKAAKNTSSIAVYSASMTMIMAGSKVGEVCPGAPAQTLPEVRWKDR